MIKRSSTDTPEQADWRAEFEKVGETALRDGMNYREMPFREPKRQFAFRWLREKESDRAHRERQIQRDVRWTLWAAIGAIIVGVIGVVVTLIK